MVDLQEKLRTIPAIDRLLLTAADQPDLAGLPRDLLVRQLRQAAEQLRQQVRRAPDTAVSPEAVLAIARARLAQLAEPSLRPVINATGVVLHTNLGRAPLSRRARERVAAVMGGYSTLEYEVVSGERGSRYSHVAARIAELTGAEAAIVVNNNAAAVLLVLSVLAHGREVIVSRGQLVEIGGSFRVPDVLRQSGATLVEVGTTNKTHVADYEAAIGPDTAAILKVHTSNYRIIGFTAQPEDAELVELARRHDLPVLEDLGSGSLVPVTAPGWREPAVGERLAAGMDIVTFSGDKLFGGAQAGIIAGKRDYVARMRKHPLLRAIRIDKLSLAALEGTLLDYQLGRPDQDIPVQQMLHRTPADLAAQAGTLAAGLDALDGEWQAEPVAVASQAGGGALPAVDLDGWAVSLTNRRLSAATLEKRLRQRRTPIIVRVQDDRVLFDVRCLSENDMAEVIAAVRAIGDGGTA